MPSTAQNRVMWADIAKGVSIIGVCLMHIVTGIPQGRETVWGHVSTVLDPLRMPLFFLISGYFSHRILDRTLTDLAYRRLWFLLVPYVVYGIPLIWVRANFYENGADWKTICARILTGTEGLWFLYALILYNVLAWCTRRLPPVQAILFSFLPVCLVVVMGWSTYFNIRNIVVYMPVFFIGLYGRSLVDWCVKNHAVVGVFLPCAFLFITWEYIYRPADSLFLGIGFSNEIAAISVMMALVRALVALGFGIIVSMWLTYIPYVRDFLIIIGRNTLPIYATHHIAVTLYNFSFLPWLHDTGISEELTTNVSWVIIQNILVVTIVGIGFYFIGKLPVIGWTLYPPRLPGYDHAVAPRSYGVNKEQSKSVEGRKAKL